MFLWMRQVCVLLLVSILTLSLVTAVTVPICASLVSQGPVQWGFFFNFAEDVNFVANGECTNCVYALVVQSNGRLCL